MNSSAIRFAARRGSQPRKSRALSELAATANLMRSSRDFHFCSRLAMSIHPIRDFHFESTGSYSSLTQSPSFDPPSCMFCSGRRLELYQARFHPAAWKPNRQTLPFQCILRTPLRPSLPGHLILAAPTASVYRVATKTVILRTISANSRRGR